jgi:cellulose synthase (UDP-forming)
MKSSPKWDFVFKWALRGLVFCGLIAFAYYLSWFPQSYQSYAGLFSANPGWFALLLIALVGALLYGGTQILAIWFLYLVARDPEEKPLASPNLRVDVFVTSCGEPYEMIANTLAAACGLRGKHTTWLLDDGQDPKLAALAESLGAGYLTRSNKDNAKAGNLNAALERTTGDIVVIFDIDHVPRPDFLERCLGLFSDPKMGFVQVMLTFSNAQESWVAQAANETSLEYYNPTSLGAAAIGGSTLMGSNALIRRAALESIGGYQPGLAEDLATSIRLHAAGWKSSYVAAPLAPGLVPATFVAWFIQQMKWARGVFDLLVTSYPRLFRRLSWGQRLTYLVRMTKYWVSTAFALHLLATLAALILGDEITRNVLDHYVSHLLPLMLVDETIRYFAFYVFVWRHHISRPTLLLKGTTLVFSTWPVYLSAWLMTLMRINLAFRPTPKSADGRLKPTWLAPQSVAVLLLVIGLLNTVILENHQPVFLISFSIFQGVFQTTFLVRWIFADLIGRAGKPAPGEILVEPLSEHFSQR